MLGHVAGVSLSRPETSRSPRRRTPPGDMGAPQALHVRVSALTFSSSTRRVTKAVRWLVIRVFK